MVLDAFGAEADRLATQMLGLTTPDWRRPTGCTPWTVAELLGHVLTTVTWLPGMIAGPAPESATTTAVGYYRRDERFSVQGNAQRVGLAMDRAAKAQDGDALAKEFDLAWREIADLCARQPLDRLVRTRHGDSMLLIGGLVTRVVELGVHGLDLAAALDRPPWLTSAASTVLTTLLLGDDADRALRDLGWDPLTFVSKATGRQPMTAAERDRVESHGVQWLALG